VGFWEYDGTTFNPYSDSELSASTPPNFQVNTKKIHTLRGVHYAHVTHMHADHVILFICYFSQSKFSTQYDRLTQKQLTTMSFSLLRSLFSILIC